MKHRIAGLATLALAAGSAALLAAPAHAQAGATAEITGFGLRYQAGDGQTNHVTIDTVWVASGQFLVKKLRVDDVVAIAPGSGCDPVVGDPTRVTCTFTNLITVRADDGNDSVVVNSAVLAQLYGEDGNDTLTSGPTASASFNRLDGGPGNDTLTGNSGSDQLIGGTGADAMSGKAGVDLVNYSDHSTPVYADLDGANSDDGALFEHDSIASDVENLYGGSAGDVLTGNASANTIYGGSGNDTLVGGLGDDDINGGFGTDTASYVSHAANVVADLDPDNPDGASGEADTITAVESLAGGSGNDYLIGDANANRLIGGAGNDVLLGQDGSDSLYGDAGNDSLYGGDDADFLVGGIGSDVIDGGNDVDTTSYADHSTSVDVRIGTGDNKDGNATDGPAGTRDNVTASVEDVFGTAGNDVIVGSGVANELHGYAGTDYLYGGGGDDELYGGAAFDYLYGQAGYDLCDVGNGTLNDPVEGSSFTCETAAIPQ